MKYLSRFILFLFVATVLNACDKIDTLPTYESGLATALSASATSVAAIPADSLKTAITFSWTNPKYATDSASYKYVIEIDSATKNFSNPQRIEVSGALNKTLTAKELNTILLNRGYAFNVPVDLEIRIISSYANNNERITSNVLKLRATPYKIPPKVALPASGKLFLVGDATQGGWNNPVPVPSQQFAQIDATTWGGIFQLNGGKQYLVLPVNGDWTNKYSITNNMAGMSAGGDFGYNLNDNFPGPATSGLYKIIIDFQSGKYTVTSYAGVLPNNLFIVGDATAGGWNNPVPVPSQQFTRVNSSVFEITMSLVGGKQYLLLPINGDWSNKFAVANNTIAGLSAGGSFGYNLNDNFPAPATSGTYKITVNFITGKFTVQ